MITDVIKERNEIKAIRVAMYNMQGSRIIYDGYWTNYKYNIRGELHLGVKFSEKHRAEYSSDPLAMLYKGEFCMGIRRGRGRLRRNSVQTSTREAGQAGKLPGEGE